jgi:hypothetical protein
MILVSEATIHLNPLEKGIKEGDNPVLNESLASFISKNLDPRVGLFGIAAQSGW